MNKRSFKIDQIKLPRMAEGGGFDYYSSMAGLGNIPQAQNQNDDFLHSTSGERLAKINQRSDQIEQGVKAAEKAISVIPVWGQLAAGASMAGRAIGKKTKDEFGMYKSKGSEVVNNAVNPVEGIKGFMDVVKDPSLEGVANKLTLGLVGQTNEQRDLAHAKDVFQFDNVAQQGAENEKVGAMIKAATPVFQAPAYGKHGLKFPSGKKYSTKFSNFSK